MCTVDADRHPLARANHQVKLPTYRGKHVAAIAPSRWMETAARESGVFPENRIPCIPYEISQGPWQEQERATARPRLGIPDDLGVVLFGTDSVSCPRKGGDLLAAALGGMSAGSRPVRLVSFGKGGADFPGFAGIEHQSFGHIGEEERLAALFAAADVFVTPSREDNLPNVVLESLASGTPVVAFRIGGMPDMIEDGVTGRLAAPFSTAGLMAAIRDILDWNEQRRIDVARVCRERMAKHFSSERQRRAVLVFYREFLAGAGGMRALLNGSTAGRIAPC